MLLTVFPRCHFKQTNARAHQKTVDKPFSVQNRIQTCLWPMELSPKTTDAVEQREHVGRWCACHGSLENPESGIPLEFRRNFSRSVFLIQNDSDDFSEECTSSEYTPKINRRLSEGFRSYPNSPVFFKACFFFSIQNDSEDISEEYTSFQYTPKINRRLSKGFRSYLKIPE